MRWLTILLCIAWLCCLTWAKESLSASNLTSNPTWLWVQFKGLSDEELRTFDSSASQPSAYHLWVIDHADAPDICAELEKQQVSCLHDVSSEYVDQGAPAVTDASLREPVTATVFLKKALRSDLKYVLVVSGIAPAPLRTSLDSSFTIVSLASNQNRKALRITAPVPIKATLKQQVKIQRTREVEGQAGKLIEQPKAYTGTIQTIDTDGIVVRLHEKLPDGKTSVLKTSLVDYYGAPVQAAGKIDTISAPTQETDAYLLAKLGSSEAVHQKPVFTAAGKIAPFQPPIERLYLGHDIQFSPEVDFDIGFNTTKSANSVTFPTPFSRYSCIMNSAWYCSDFGLNALNISFGPRLETDRQFQRFNGMGEFRLDFYLKDLSHNFSAKKAKLSAASPTMRDTIELSEKGYYVAPYFAFDGGANAIPETVTNSKIHKSVTVPTNAITRAYIGLKGVAQYGPLKITLDQYYVEMLSREQIGYTTPSTVGIRSLIGWHPHEKASIDIFFDPAKHYSVNITYENGRIAPNFEYLNKVDTGIKIIY